MPALFRPSSATNLEGWGIWKVGDLIQWLIYEDRSLGIVTEIYAAGGRPWLVIMNLASNHPRESEIRADMTHLYLTKVGE